MVEDVEGRRGEYVTDVSVDSYVLVLVQTLHARRLQPILQCFPDFLVRCSILAKASCSLCMATPR